MTTVFGMKPSPGRHRGRHTMDSRHCHYAGLPHVVRYICLACPRSSHRWTCLVQRWARPDRETGWGHPHASSLAQ